MDSDELKVTLALAGTVGFLSALLPAADKLFDSDPGNEQLRRQVIGANTAFGAISLILIGLAFGAGHKQAAVIGTLILATATFYYNYAFLANPIPDNIEVIE